MSFGPPHPASLHRRALFELLLGYGCILLVLWTPRPIQRPLYCLATLVLIVLCFRRRVPARALGLTTHHALRSGVLLIPAACLVIVAVWLAARRHTLHVPLTPFAFLSRYWGYALWAFAQQFLLQNFFLQRLRRILPGRTRISVVLAAALFAFAHLPSPVLMTLTLVWGLVACAWFVRYRNLYAPAITHALLGICVASTMPSRITHNMRVGLGYLTYRPHPLHPHRRKSDHTESTRV